jgi:exonuclease III
MNAHPFKTLVWNVRGLNNPARRNAISQVVQAACPSIVCFQETKMEVVTVEIVRHCLGNKFEKFFYLPAIGTRGGILLAWDASVVALSNPHRTENTLSALVQHVEGVQWWITGVYGPQLDHEKILFM